MSIARSTPKADAITSWRMNATACTASVPLKTMTTACRKGFRAGVMGSVEPLLSFKPRSICSARVYGPRALSR